MELSPKDRLRNCEKSLEGKEGQLAEHLRIIISVLLHPDFEPAHYMVDNIINKMKDGGLLDM